MEPCSIPLLLLEAQDASFHQFGFWRKADQVCLTKTVISVLPNFVIQASSSHHQVTLLTKKLFKS